jgi:hypothetical protein
MSKPVVFLRIAAVLTFIHAVLHTVGGVFGDIGPGAATTAVQAMKANDRLLAIGFAGKDRCAPPPANSNYLLCRLHRVGCQFVQVLLFWAGDRGDFDRSMPRLGHRDRQVSTGTPCGWRSEWLLSSCAFTFSIQTITISARFVG